MRHEARTIAVVVQFGETRLARQCVESLGASEGVALRTLVIDHNPRRDEELACMTEYVHVPENPGFAGGVNRGLREAGGLDDLDLVVALNPDVFVEPDCLLRLAEALDRDARVGIVGPALMSADGRAPPRWWNVGSDIRWPQAAPSSRRHGETVSGDPLAEEDVGYVCGALMAIRPRVLSEIGFLPEEYGLYFEDADFCFRARRAGYSCRVVPQARAYHVGGASFKDHPAEAPYYQVRNRILFSRRWSPTVWRGRLARGIFVARVLFRAGWAAAMGRRMLASAYARGIRDGVFADKS